MKPRSALRFPSISVPSSDSMPSSRAIRHIEGAGNPAPVQPDFCCPGVGIAEIEASIDGGRRGFRTTIAARWSARFRLSQQRTQQDRIDTAGKPARHRGSLLWVDAQGGGVARIDRSDRRPRPPWTRRPDPALGGSSDRSVAAGPRRHGRPRAANAKQRHQQIAIAIHSPPSGPCGRSGNF